MSSSAHPHRRWLVLALLLWLAFVLVMLSQYYRRIGDLWQLGPVAWVQDNPSLEYILGPLWDGLRGGALPSWPALPQALARAAGGLLGAGLVLLAAQWPGELALRLVRAPLRSPLVRWPFRTGIGLGLVAYLSLALALAGVYTPAALRGLTAVLALVSLAWLIRGWRLNAFRKVVALLTPRSWVNKVFLALIVLALGLAFLAALAPETAYDALWYHLWLPQQWLQAGHPVDFVHEYISLYPLTWELVYGAGMVWGGPVAARLLHWACLPLTTMLVFAMTRRAAPQASPWLAAVLFASIPSVMWEASVAYNDLALAFYLALAGYALLRYGATRRRSFVWLAALTFGLALAVKHLALAALLIAALLLGMYELRTLGGLRPAHNLRRAFSLSAGFAVVSLLLPLPWYLRAYAASGNPVFPDLYSLFGAFPPERWSPITEAGLQRFKEGFGFGHSLPALLALPWSVTVHAQRFGGSLGPLFLLLLPGILWAAWRSRLLGALLVFCGLYLLVWASPLSSLQLRFLLPLTPLLAVLGAAGWTVFVQLWQWVMPPGAAWQVLPALGLIALLALNLPPFTSLHEADRDGWNGWLTHVLHRIPLGVVLGWQTEDAYLGEQVASYAAWQYIDRRLPPDALVLTFSGGDHLYSHRPRLWSDATAAHRAVWGAPPEADVQVLSELQRLGVTDVLIDRRQMDRLGPVIPLLDPAFQRRYFDQEYADDAYLLLALKSAQMEEQP